MTAALPASPIGLDALESRLRQDLDWLDWPKKRWTPVRMHEGAEVLDVAIVGAGMAGLAAAAAMMQLGLRPVLFDQASAGLEGPWATTARMETLRSPKQLAGPALGLPALTFRAWFEAQYGRDAWDVLDKIPRLQWMDYLRWYRRVLALDVRNEHRVHAIRPQADGLVALHLSAPGAVPDASQGFVRYARRVVLATGRDGLGGAWVPDYAHALPRTLWAHSADALDYTRLAGRRVGVVGAGASAMDVAATALEAGARSVDLLIRRADLPRVNKGKGAGNPGFVHGFRHLPDRWKWRIRHYLARMQTPPPHNSTLRVSRHGNARFHFACPIERVAQIDDGRGAVAVEAHTPKGRFVFDFVLFSTGFQIDWSTRPEFAAFAPHVLAWKDRFAPEDGSDDREMADSPYLGDALEFQQRTPGACPGLERIHCFAYPATLSHGTVTGDIPAISDGALRLAQALAARLYAEDIEHHYTNIEAFDDPELDGTEWTPFEGAVSDASRGAAPVPETEPEGTRP
ncbi:MAG: SidA/IucD/PvdA family monooxygenase [Lautropia sp.]